jgi:Protein of unknown function (DUF1579)
MDKGPVAEHERLTVLIGRWKTEGSTREMPDAPAARIDAFDTYEWLPGGFGLLHVVDAQVGETKVEGAEIIGYDGQLHVVALDAIRVRALVAGDQPSAGRLF